MDVLEGVVKAQFSAAAEQLFVLEPEVAFACPLPLRDDDRRPLDTAHEQPDKPLRLRSLLEQTVPQAERP